MSRYGRSMPGARTPTCVWRATPELIVALDEKFGEPVDTYVNGSQVWLREDGPDDAVLEWRLHPVAGYVRPNGLETEEVFSVTALALASDEPLPAPLQRVVGWPRMFSRVWRRHGTGDARRVV